MLTRIAPIFAVAYCRIAHSAQFGDPADLAAYPRDEERDAEIVRAEGVDVLFAPAAEEIYPPGFGTWVDVEATGAEGPARPGHFLLSL